MKIEGCRLLGLTVWGRDGQVLMTVPQDSLGQRRTS